MKYVLDFLNRNCRYYIAFKVGVISQFMHSSTEYSENLKHLKPSLRERLK